MIEHMFKTGGKYLMKTARGLMKLRFHISREKKEILSSYGWYANLHGGYTHPHAMDYLYRHEIAAMTPEHLHYAMQHGSQAVYIPDNN